MPKVVPEYKEDAKRRIVEAAMDVIAERGYNQMTIDGVAEKLGVTKGAVYWYFSSREDLVSAVLKKFQTDIERVSFESYYNRPAGEIFSQIFDRFSLTDERQRAIFFEMVALAARNSDVRHATREYYQGLVATFEEAIKREKKQHFVQTQADARTLALMMAALFAGLQNYEMVWIPENEIRDLWIEGVRILLQPTYTGSYGEDRTVADKRKP